MPRNKYALIRYRVINRCLLDYRYCSKEQLIKACEKALDISPIGARTIDQDIHDMRYDSGLGYNAPIKFDRNRGCYYYGDPEYSIDKLPLSHEELDALTFSASMLEQYGNIDIFSRFRGAVQKIVDAVTIQKMQQDQPAYPFIEFEKMPLTRGSEFLQPLVEAISKKQVISLMYHAFWATKPFKVILHPYLLKEYRNRWYVIGLNNEYQEMRMYGLDRIVGLEEHDRPFIDKNFDSASYFRNTIGVIAPMGEPPEIVITVKKDQAHYLMTQPIHESQRVIEEKEDEIIFSLKVHPTYELKAILLGMGSDVKVNMPKSLVDEIGNELNNMIKYYSCLK